MLSLILFILGLLYIMAHLLPTNLMNRLRGVGIGPQLPDQPPSQRDTSSAAHDEAQDDNSYKPTPLDIVLTRALLTQARKIPPDIVDAIFDYAEYWAHSSNEIDYMLEHKSPLRIIGRSPKEDHFLVRSFPIGLTGISDREDLADILQYDTNETKPRPLQTEHEPAFFAQLAKYPTPVLAHPVRKIVFTTRSRDQGMAPTRTEGIYEDGWTWFEAGLERFDAEQQCEPQCVSDLRYKSTKSVATTLPVCALRPVYPLFSPVTRPASTATQTPEEGERADEPVQPVEPEYRYDHGFLPVDERIIQRNRTRNREMKTHVVQWSWTDDINPETDQAKELTAIGRGRATGDGSFVRNLKMGDVVTVWGKAKFPAWNNNIEKVKIDVYWAV